jgi:hypothetical protein
MTALQETVDPDSWRNNGGLVGAIREWAGRLIIMQYPRNHQRIESLLKLLYEASAPMGPELARPTTFPAVLRLAPAGR